jgi:hypothetical protein
MARRPAAIRIDPEGAGALVEAIRRHRYPSDSSGRILARAPRKDEASHLSDALKYLVWTLRPQFTRGSGAAPGLVRDVLPDRPQVLTEPW